MRWFPSIATLILFVAHGWYLACIAEDSYITFRYAEHLANGLGLVWNPGEAPIEGYTNFLWVVACAALSLLGLPIAAGAQVLGLAAGAATLLVTHRFARELLDLRGLRAWIAPLLLACSGPMACWAASGMETVIFALLVLSAALATGRYLQTARRGALFAAFGWLLAAALTRPEGLLVATALGLLLLAEARSRGWTLATTIRRLGTPALVLALPGALYFGWRLAYFGDWLPNTYYAKTGASLAQLERGAAYLAYFAQCFLLPVAWTPLVAAALARRQDTTRPQASVGMRICAVVALPYLSYIVLVGGDYMAMARFVVPVLPFLMLAASAWIARALDAAATVKGRRLLSLAALLSAVGIALQSTPLERHLFDTPWFGFGTYRGVETERWQVARLLAIGEFFGRYGREGESIATRSIGAIGYVSRLAVFDLHGLTDRHIARQRGHDLGTRFAGHEKQDLAYSISRRPTFVMLSRHLSPRPASMTALPESLQGLVSEQYQVVSVEIDDRANGERGFLNFLERRDR